MRDSLTRLATILSLSALAATVITACSGGGSTAPAASPGPPLGGIGSTLAFNQKVNFTVIVPPATTTNAIAAARRKSAANASSTNPYVSPKTASVSLRVVTVNSVSPQTLPPPTVVNITCSGTSGCSVPIQNVPAAQGVNRFYVQTYAGPGATGNVISTGYVDVTAPSTQATSFGGTALTIGGFVQSIALAVNPPAGGFVWNTASTGSVDVNALDPAGAIIIGSDQLAFPIILTAAASDEGAFSFSGQPTATLQQPAQAVPISYTGAVLPSGSITASTTGGRGQTVTAAVTIPISAPPTPQPSPIAPGKPLLSLYVYDGSSNEILEYDGVNGVEAGGSFSTTPRRLFEVAPPPGSPIVCPIPLGSPTGPFPNVSSFAVSSNGSIYVQTDCTDQTNTLAYTFTYPANATETNTAPPPATTFSVAPPGGYYGQSYGLKLDEARGLVLLQYPNANYTGSDVFGVSITNPANITTNFGAACMQELGQRLPCASNSTYYTSTPSNFAVDGSGYIYTPSLYSSTDALGNNWLPPGSRSESFVGEPAILAFPEGINNPAPAPFSALAGFHDELGGGDGIAPSIAIDGSTLYAFTHDNSGQISAPGDLSGNTPIYPGLSSCGATLDSTVLSCSIGVGVNYLTVFPSATQSLTTTANAGQNVVIAPTTVLGGDIVGGFGYQTVTTTGDLLAVRDGFAFVLNNYPPSNSPNAEIDVYDLNTITGVHVDTPPVTKLVFPSTITPTTIAIGPTGSAVTPAAILRRPARVHFDFKSWARRQQQLRQALINRRRLHP